jgi:hypothetical protein
MTPARLIAAGKPMFRPTFSTLFPFILRRTTATVHACCGEEMTEEVKFLLDALKSVSVAENRLTWRDWRKIGADAEFQDLGGVVGSVRLEGEGLPRLLWVLNVGRLLNIGKSAAFGGGHYRLMRTEGGGRAEPET